MQLKNLHTLTIIIRIGIIISYHNIMLPTHIMLHYSS